MLLLLLFYCFFFQEWNDRLPHQFIGSYRLENDLTWTPVEKIESRECNLRLANNIINSNLISEEDSCERMLLDTPDSCEKMSVGSL